MAKPVPTAPGREALVKAGLSRVPSDSHVPIGYDSGRFEFGLFHVACGKASLNQEDLDAADALEGTTFPLTCHACGLESEGLADPNKYGEVFLQTNDPKKFELWYAWHPGAPATEE